MNDRQQIFGSEQDDLDTLLDRALSSYTPAHPRLGLEDRVRAGFDSAAGSAHSRERIPMLWVWAGAAALVTVLLAGLILRPHASREPAHRASVPSGPSTPSIPANQLADLHPARARAHPSRRLPASAAQPPRLTPRQPSQQQLIAQLLANGPEAIASLARDNDQLDRPIDIQSLPVDPLVTDPIKITPIDDDPAEPGGNF
jgi:hypothetical protein